jgi:hypothetical protein
VSAPSGSRAPAPAPELRYERKVAVAGFSLQETELWVRTHPAAFRVQHPSREVNNVYLDTPGLAAFAAHVNGAERRFKLRVRWYGAPRGRIAAPVLEVKLKRGHVGTKLRFALPPLEYDGGLDVGALRAALAPQVSDRDLAAAIGHSLPVLFNRYERRYYESGDRRFRLTVDTGLRFESVRGRRIGPLDAHEERDLLILELKYAVADDAVASRIFERLPFRLGKSSKYLLGVARLGGRRP